MDIGHLMVVRNELQNAADAAALAGAPCLYPRAACANTGTVAPDWATATLKASAAVHLNKSERVTLTSSTVAYGHWNITGLPAGLQSPPLAAPGANDLPAIRVAIQKSGTDNGGAVSTFLATVLGRESMPVSANAVAVVSSPGFAAPGNLFPVAITKCLYDNFWDSTTHLPKLATQVHPPGFDPKLTQVIGQPYVFWITSSYHAGPCEVGQWTSLDIDSNDVPTIRDLIANGNPTKITVAQGGATCNTQPTGCIWIEPGTKNTLYTDVDNCSAAGNKSCEYVPVPVVNDISTHSNNSVVAFACLHILSAEKGSGKYIVAQMSANADKCQMKNSGGVGPAYGALTPPRLVH